MTGGKSTKASDMLDTLCTPPEVCGEAAEDNKRQHLLQQTTNDGTNFFTKNVKRDKALLVAILLMAVVLHIPTVRFILYPFMIFSTWVHEMCHGMAAILVGGGVRKLMVYKDGSGLAYTWTTGEDWKRAFVASAGYTGTALIGGFLLLWRRTRRGPTVGLIVIGCAMLLSCAMYVRNAFGVAATLSIGIVLLLFGWKLPAQGVLYMYCFLAATCSFNALDAINDLMDIQEGEAYVNGQQTSTDAHTVADLIGMTYGFWAVLWLIFGLFMSAVGLLLPFNGVTYQKNKKAMRKAQEGALPQHGIAMVTTSNTQQAPPAYEQPTVSAPSPAVNPAWYHSQQAAQPPQQQTTTQQHAWQQVEPADIPIAQATIY
ncbi:expressed unknown protein [Seminavis robusta]|uniref:Uncharacterized protein n=1 Tax=Seminavis robusta TaxID=568900 RepID=A0A9N8DP11_9STRA|nr:expressed unknown protein [Seminavis robusta]|eukprot:Sro190_g081720.1 n/a (371) ;mRNA; r:14757-15869